MAQNPCYYFPNYPLILDALINAIIIKDSREKEDGHGTLGVNSRRNGS